jgi:FMN phosphatase YigB (HAD superfamily)
VPRPVLIFDFDGTVALGDGPVLAYAASVAAAGRLSESFIADVRRGLGDPTAENAVDGYDLVRILALRAGADEAHLAFGYRASRGMLATTAAPIGTPAGLARLLDAVDAERILLTNAPDVRLAEALEALGLAGRFDRIVTDAAKPAGLEALLDALDPARPVLSIGDIWRNDLAPAHARGHATALVGPSAAPDARPTYRAARLDDLLDDIAGWVLAARVA